MSDPKQVAKKLRDVSEEGDDPAARRLAMLHLLRSELDESPLEAVLVALREVRAEVAPGDTGSEAMHLWECVGGGAIPTPATPSAPESTGGLERQAREVLGGPAVPAGGFSPEMAERWIAIVTTILVNLLRYEAEFQRLYRKLKQEAAPSAEIGTSLGIGLERPLKSILVEILEGKSDLHEMENRLKRFALASWRMYDAHLLSSISSREALQKRLDPNQIQRSAPGRDYWAHYRQLYHQELYDFSPAFTEIFVETEFLKALLIALKKT